MQKQMNTPNPMETLPDANTWNFIHGFGAGLGTMGPWAPWGPMGANKQCGPNNTWAGTPPM